jgi:hypothetical protein
MIAQEKQRYADLPRFYDFGSEEERSRFLLKYLENIYREINELNSI